MHDSEVEVENEDAMPLLAQNSCTNQKSSKLHRHKSLLIFIGAGCLAAVIICFYAITRSPQFDQYHLLRAYQSTVALSNDEGDSSQLHRTRTMLFWNGFFDSKTWGLPDDTLGPTYFRDELQCPIYNCELTNQHEFLPSVDMYDAVLFHTAEPFALINSIPTKRNWRQLYVFALMEPPSETKHILSDEEYFYNLTMTYRLDSDILWPYKSIMDRVTGENVAPSNFPNWRSVPDVWNETKIWQQWPNKIKMAAWFVSHCETLSQRERLAAELQKYIDVDVFGKCGKMSCHYQSKECDRILDEKYKFYFSFENALCNDYVTEKLYNALDRDIIPIVFGGANYTRFLPPHSYINVEDFESIESLAAYLEHLATHPIEYLRYFWWRRYYQLTVRSPYCDLCAKLHSITYREKAQTYRDIKKWWLANQCRFDAKIHF